MNTKSSTQDRSSQQPREDLASLIEQAINSPVVIVTPAHDAGYEAPAARPAPAGLAETLPNRLIEELSAAQAQMRGESPLNLDLSDAMPAARAGRVVSAQGPVDVLRDLRCRYLALLSFVHRHIFDRRIERLLFSKTPAPQSWLETAADGQRRFRYRGPVPEMVLGWALSALPADLKRFAFVDFEAGNGRTLLLAARKNFEHAIGYTQDSNACAILEMNLAQYSRSYMSCRDVRALRGDRDGIPIPSQPAVLFFPASLSQGQLGSVFGGLAASMPQAPRPLYLIFECSGPERKLEQMKSFRRVPLPFVNRLRTKLFSPANIAVYKSRDDGAA